MKKPLIGLTPIYDNADGRVYTRPAYLDAIKAAGGLPVIMPLKADKGDLAQLVHNLDGFLFTGGPDVHPFHFGQQTHPACGSVSMERDSLELSLLPVIMEAQKPILGICRGLQLLNVGLGGTLYQDIPSQFHSPVTIAHSQTSAADVPCHHVQVEENTLLFSVVKESRISVNSLHHQAVETLAPALKACAFAADGIVEAAELPDYPFFLGVQWHPERLWEKDDQAAAVFEALIHWAAK